MTVRLNNLPPETRRYFIPTSEGEVSLIFAPEPLDNVTVFVHGAARNSTKLAKWVRSGAALLELPGHGTAPLIDGRVEVWSAAFQAAIDKVWPFAKVTVVGESLGGIIAMLMSPSRTIALDPPIEPTEAVEREILYGNVAEFLRPMLRTNYWHILDKIDRPIEVVCATNGILNFDTKSRLSAHRQVLYKEVESGHLILDENPDAISQMLD